MLQLLYSYANQVGEGMMYNIHVDEQETKNCVAQRTVQNKHIIRRDQMDELHRESDI